MKKFFLIFIPGVIVGFILLLLGGKAVRATSDNEYCASCHIHPQATTSWKQSVHYITPSGTRVDCIECHLPPKGEGHLVAKARTGIHDVWSKWTKDPDSFDWEAMSRLEVARDYVPESTCLYCHETIFTPELSREGEEAHLYYDQNSETKDLHCINCHLNAGHYIEGYTHGGNETFGLTGSTPELIFTEPAEVNSFDSFNEKIPGSPVSFNMIAIPGGKFRIGSPEDEPFRDPDEGPSREINISRFFMAEVEVTWDAYLAFYSQTAAEGRTTDTEGVRTGAEGVDAITGATPPYGQPDQNWGLGERPVISITHHAAETYCRWLSQVTEKSYRLPTEAEWEYAARAGSDDPYFFGGDPGNYERRGMAARLRKNDTTVINSFVIYRENSSARTQTPDKVKANSFGLKNTLGNVAEFCSDWYMADTYSLWTDGETDPVGPDSGTEYVIRGGSFRNSAGNIRVADRNHTRKDDWLRTDPQMPKSIWWYSDCFHVGLRVVCEFDKGTGNYDN